jgi:hypothetical protein
MVVFFQCWAITKFGQLESFGWFWLVKIEPKLGLISETGLKQDPQPQPEPNLVLILEPELKAETLESIFFEEKKFLITKKNSTSSYVWSPLGLHFFEIPKRVTLITSSEPNVFQSVQNEKTSEGYFGGIEKGGGGREGKDKIRYQN